MVNKGNPIRINGVVVGHTMDYLKIESAVPIKFDPRAEPVDLEPTEPLEFECTRVVCIAPGVMESIFGWICSKCGNGANDPTVHECLVCGRPR